MTDELEAPFPEDPRPPWLRALMVLVPAGLGVLLLLSAPYALRLLGTGLASIALYGLLLESGRLRAFLAGPVQLGRFELRWLPRAAPALVLVFVAAGLLWPCLVGAMPQSQDHPVHLARAWHFLTRMLASGRLSGWSNLWFAGWPAGEDYPPGGDWWISAFYLGSFGLLGWEGAYALAFLCMMALSAVAVYAFGRTYLGRTAGFLAGLFFLLDRGQYREGGWSYTVWWGVWPQVFSTALTLFSLATLDRVLVRGRPRDYAVCALLTGGAILAHPVSAIYFGLGVPLYLIVRALGSEEPAGRVFVRSFAALGLGAALAAFWLVPFSAKGAWMAKYGELWKSLPTMAQGLWRGTLFDNVAPPIIWLGVLGGALAAWRRSVGGLFLAVWGSLMLFLASSSAFSELGLLRLSPAFGQVQFQRLSIPAKMCLFLLAGYALQSAFTALRARPFRYRAYALGCLLLLCVAPFVQPVLQDWGQNYGAELGRPKTRRDFDYWGDYQEFLKWSAARKKEDASFYRIAYVRPYNDHFFAAAPIFNGTPAYKVGFTPAINFIHKPDVGEPEVYRALNVKYVVSIGPTPGSDLEEERRFGPIVVYRFKGYSPARTTLRGPGRVEVESFEDERVRLKLSGTTAESRLLLHVANYPNWRASVNGERLPIETGTLAGQKIFLEVPARDGLLELRYGWPAVNAASAFLSWLGLLVLGLMVAARYRPALAGWLARKLLPLGQRLERRGVLVALLLVLVPGVGLGLKALTRGKTTSDGSVLTRLSSAVVELERGGIATRCAPERGDRYQCSEATWNYVGPESYRVGGEFRQCLWAHPVEGAILRVRFPGVTLKRRLVGHHGLLDDAVQGFPAGAPVTLEVFVGGEKKLTQVRSNTTGWEGFSVDTSALAGRTAELRFQITTPSAAGRHYCFEAAVE